MVYRWGSDAITLSLSCLSSSSDSHTFAHSQSSAVQHPLLEHAQPGCSPQPSHTTPGSPSVPSQYIRVYTFFLLSSSIIVSLYICLYVGICLKRPNAPLCSVPVSVCPYPSVPDPCAQYGWDQHTWPHFPRPSEDIGFSPRRITVFGPRQPDTFPTPAPPPAPTSRTIMWELCHCHFSSLRCFKVHCHRIHTTRTWRDVDSSGLMDEGNSLFQSIYTLQMISCTYTH